jgi:hypothetical protein
MNPGDLHRVAKRHLDRNALVYVRQSDPRLVREHTESTALQRNLRERAIAMGWPMPKLVEDDLGNFVSKQPGKGREEREGKRRFWVSKARHLVPL